ncbi:hypothetical protein BDQ17DRAFT_1420623 [Cyathus striatus]|nr:hypothetical protein BDQ17DRAFT_1420623 [Cyathus striatus]
MPLLGLFGKKKSSSSSRTAHNDDQSSTHSHVSPQLTLSPTSTHHSVYPSANSAASSSKLRLFARKKNAHGNNSSTASVNTTHTSNAHLPMPRPPYTSRVSTSTVPDFDPDDVASTRRMRPPPSKSAIFAAYNDPNGALSTRSLPAPMTPVSSPFRAELHQAQKLKKDPPSPPPPAPPPKKRQGLFPWSKSTPSSPATKAPPSPQVTQTPDPGHDSSFNLKAFRHVRHPSPPIPPMNLNFNASAISLSNSTLTPPVPRPRGTSVNSDSSQRISVAAFREAQARRSQAGSPSPGADYRSVSPVPPLNPSISQNNSPVTAPVRRENMRRSTAPVSMLYTSSTDEEEDEEEEEDDSDDEDDTMRPQRKRTITDRSQSRPRALSRPGKSKARAQSELGHGSATRYTASPKSHLGHGAIVYTQPLRGGDDEAEDRANARGKWALPRSQSSLGTYASARQRASASTSAVSPSAAAKRASVIAQANSYLGDTPADDDTPLGTLLPPRRPGSAMSSYSNGSKSNLNVNNKSHTNLSTSPAPASRSNSQIPPKPLIDINELKQRPPQVGPPKKNDDAFTGGLLGMKMVESPLGSPTATSPTPSFGLVSKLPPARFVSPPASPAKEIQAMNLVSSGETHERNDSALSTASTTPSPPGEKRDIFGERLARVVKSHIHTRSSSRPDIGRDDSGGSAETGTTGSEERVSSSSPPPPLPAPANRERGRTTSPANGLSDARDNSSPRRPTFDTRLSGGRGTSTPKSPIMQDPPSSPDEELARMLGDSIKLISFDGGEDTSESSSDEDEDEEDEEEEEKGRKKGEEEEGERGRGEKKKEDIFLPPIPIKQRSPPPAFSVTSRPQHPRNSLSVDSTATLTPLTLGPSREASPAAQRMRQRSSTLLPPSSTSMAPFPGVGVASSAASSTPGSSSSSDLWGSGSNSTVTSSQPPRPVIGGRQRSSTMVPISSPTASKAGVGMGMPSRPFAAPQRRDSPASSTGDSSSGRAPLTPRDGSEIGVASGKARDRGREKAEKEQEGWGSGVSGLGTKPKHVKRKSVNFDDEVEGRGVGKGKMPEETDNTREERRKERRRGEARAAIELGNVINGRGPIVDDDDDDEDDMPINQAMNARMSTAINPMMGAMPMQQTGGWPGMNMPMGMWPQAPGANPQLLSPAQFMIPPPSTNDPSFLAAHQQAMLYAKQAYQIAVAQQAMAVAADEWERGSTYGGGGSVYGGGSSASVMNMPMGSPYGMSQMGMMNMQAGMAMNNGWSTGSVIFPSSRSMYNGNSGTAPMSSSRSEYGGGGGARNWSSSRTSYGEFGPSPAKNRMSRAGEGGRDSGYFPLCHRCPRRRSRLIGRQHDRALQVSLRIRRGARAVVVVRVELPRRPVGSRRVFELSKLVLDGLEPCFFFIAFFGIFVLPCYYR